MFDSIKNIAIIGSGNVAWHLAKAFHESGLRISSIYGRNAESVASLARMVNAKFCSDLYELKQNADMILIAIHDDAIVSVLEFLGDFEGIITHTSGSVGLNVFSANSHAGVFYPLQTFTKGVPINYSKMHLFIETVLPEDARLLKNLANKLSPHVFEADSNQRLQIHIAGVFACNYVNYMYCIAQDILKQNQLPPGAIDTLIIETASKALGNEAWLMQTGPARRNDKKTVEKHLEVLKENPAYARIYKLIAENITKKYNP